MEKISKVREKREDRVISLLKRVINKLSDVEVRLMNKVDVKEIEELELKVKSLEGSVKERVDELGERIATSEAKVAQKEGEGSLRDWISSKNVQHYTLTYIYLQNTTVNISSQFTCNNKYSTKI